MGLQYEQKTYQILYLFLIVPYPGLESPKGGREKRQRVENEKRWKGRGGEETLVYRAGDCCSSPIRSERTRFCP